MALALAVTATGGARAYDINDKLSIGGALGVAGQCQAVSGLTDPDNLCRGFALGRRTPPSRSDGAGTMSRLAPARMLDRASRAA